MAKFLIEVRYTAQGAKGILKHGGSARPEMVQKMVKDLGGELETFYYAFGDVDAYVIVDLPDNITAAAVGLAVNQAGAAVSKTVVLMSPKDIDKAAKKTVHYTVPAQ